MRIGTKSILFGAHQFLIHPWFVALAWWKLYGFPFDPRLWVAFFVHDLGYIGKPNMDGPEGETHVELGAEIMHYLFDHPRWITHCTETCHRVTHRTVKTHEILNVHWKNFCLYHSRFYAKRDGRSHSRLCVADKLAIALTPAWLYLPLARLTGEIHEYMKLGKDAGPGNKYANMNLWNPDQAKWYANVRAYLAKWVVEHADGRPDTWTQAARQAIDGSGVWK